MVVSYVFNVSRHPIESRATRTYGASYSDATSVTAIPNSAVDLSCHLSDRKHYALVLARLHRRSALSACGFARRDQLRREEDRVSKRHNFDTRGRS